MDIREYIELLQGLQNDLLRSDEVVNRIELVAFKALEAQYKRRIYVQGRDSQGKPIGRYSTTPFYVNPQKLVGLPKGKFKPRGKTGKVKFKNGKPHKTRYLRNGYKELRETAGRQTKNVDLNLTGSMFASVAVGRKGKRLILGYTSAKSALIMDGQEKRFKKQIEALSVDELQRFRRALVLELQAIIRESLKK